jgi:hypothetical protein
MSSETQQPEFPYLVKIETGSGRTVNVPIAFLTPQQVQRFFQTDFKRLIEEAGVTGARAHVERATTADYEDVLSQVAACLGGASKKAAA